MLATMTARRPTWSTSPTPRPAGWWASPCSSRTLTPTPPGSSTVTTSPTSRPTRPRYIVPSRPRSSRTSTPPSGMRSPSWALGTTSRTTSSLPWSRSPPPASMHRSGLLSLASSPLARTRLPPSRLCESPWTHGVTMGRRVPSIPSSPPCLAGLGGEGVRPSPPSSLQSTPREWTARPPCTPSSTTRSATSSLKTSQRAGLTSMSPPRPSSVLYVTLGQ
mmetsp:Transcript_27834/g.60909  ORF Transcript_27834/g.60909 Transcript_27834/m.60909 type:complete len:219 (-) Transcript_27834:2473-3129(-)